MTGIGKQRSQAPARHRLYAACFTALMAFGGIEVTVAVNNDAPREYSIPAGNLESALNQLSRQSQIQIAFPPELVAGKQARALSGRLTWQQALESLLEGSGLEYGQVADRTIVIRKAAGTGPREARPASAPPTTPAARRDAEVTDIERMTVTGTRIRGGTTPSPVTTIGAERIREEGFTDLGEVIRSVPQNFTGGQNPGVVPYTISGAGIQNQNVTGGSTLNLRGLGPDATLTLLNGRRIAYGGFSQAVDISAIPVEAVERIEMVTDGASAIYGSDAVGGVGNVILKRDFEGLAVGVRYGTATDGGLTTREYTATAGAAWASGGLIATYMDVSTDPIYARQRHYTTHLRDPYVIYPSSDLRSGLVSVHQSLGTVAELRLDAFKTERDQMYNIHENLGNFNVLAIPNTTTSLVSPNIEFSLPNDWTLSLGGSWSKDEHIQLQSIESIATGAILAVINNCYCNDSRMYEAGVEGPLFTLPGGDARLAAGVGHRSNEFRQINRNTGTNTIHGDEGAKFAYAEVNLPLIGPDQSIAGVRRMELTAAVRGEDYDSFGKITTPKLGLIYGPSSDFTLKASWGKSFKAPTLLQRFRERIAQLSLAGLYGGIGYPADATVLVLGGGNAALEAERARTWSASLAFHPEMLPGLEAELTWFDIDYTDRVVEPITNYSQSLSSPVYAEFVRLSPTAEEKATAIANADLFYNTVGTPYDPNSVVAIIDGNFVNAAKQQITGIDLSASYRFELGSGQLTMRGSVSWLDSSQQISTTKYDLAGTLHNPPKTSGRVGAVWNQGSFTASVFANYKGGVENVVRDEKTGSFTTLDTTLRYASKPHNGAWSGLEFALAAQNLLDRAPPLYTPTGPYSVPPYDATNYSAIGRFLSFSVSKRW